MMFMALLSILVVAVCLCMYAASTITDSHQLPSRPTPPVQPQSSGSVMPPLAIGAVTNISPLTTSISTPPLTIDNIKSLTERRVHLHGKKDNPLVARIEAELEWLESIGKTKHDDKLGMHMTVADLEMVYVYLAGLDDVITRTGPNPAQHESRIRTLAETWPYLWKRLYRLVHEE